MTRYLIIHADDLGASAGTVEAISALFEAGVVTSTSALVNQSHWPRAAAVLRQHPEWDAGVHLVMNDGEPLLPRRQAATLVDRQGRFRDGWSLLARYPIISRRQLKSEWRTQIEAFMHDTGRHPSHLDLHCHYPYVFPGWFRLSLELAQEYDRIPVRAPFDDALEQRAPQLAAAYGGFPAWLVVWLGRRYQAMIVRAGLTRANYWESSFSQDDCRTTEHLLRLLGQLEEGITELLCHPGTEGWRGEDYRALIDPRVRRRIEAWKIVLTDYTAVKEGL